MKCSVDNKTPPKMPRSIKAEIDRRASNALVELDNRILLDRLALAMTVKNIDNERKKVNFISLMEGKKKRENTRVEKDNKRLLKAIQLTVPVYNHIEWERAADKRVAVLRNMTKFPQLFDQNREQKTEEKQQIERREKNQRVSLLYKLDSVISKSTGGRPATGAQTDRPSTRSTTNSQSFQSSYPRSAGSVNSEAQNFQSSDPRSAGSVNSGASSGRISRSRSNDYSVSFGYGKENPQTEEFDRIDLDDLPELPETLPEEFDKIERDDLPEKESTEL